MGCWALFKKDTQSRFKIHFESTESLKIVPEKALCAIASSCRLWSAVNPHFLRPWLWGQSTWVSCSYTVVTRERAVQCLPLAGQSPCISYYLNTWYSYHCLCPGKLIVDSIVFVYVTEGIYFINRFEMKIYQLKLKSLLKNH